jgi:hypothetical protein
MFPTPEQRFQRLRRHAVDGWHRAQSDLAARERASQRLREHPADIPHADDLWQQALRGEGPLAEWLAADDGAKPWPLDHLLSLRSLFACHPFSDLPQWTELPK